MTDTISIVQNIDAGLIDISVGSPVELVVIQAPPSGDLITVSGADGDSIELTPDIETSEITITDTNEQVVIEINETTENSTITIIEGGHEPIQNDIDRMVNHDHPSSSREFDYDQNMNISVIRVFDGPLQLFERTMNYDLSGVVDSVVTDDLIGHKRLTKTITYDGSGNITGVSREIVSI